MPRIDSNELSNMLQSLNQMRINISEQLISAENVAVELIETQELAGSAWQNTKEYFSVYPPVTKGVWNSLGILAETLSNYLLSFETEVGSVDKRLDSDELQELQDRLNRLDQQKQELLQQFTAFPFVTVLGDEIMQQINNMQIDTIHKKVDILEKYREFELTHANDFEEIKKQFISLNEGLTQMALQKGVGNPKFGYAPRRSEGMGWLHQIEKFNEKQPQYELIEEQSTDVAYKVYHNGVLNVELSRKYQELMSEEKIKSLFDMKKEMFMKDPNHFVLGLEKASNEEISFEEWRENDFWIALDKLTVAQMDKIINNIKSGKKILDDLELTEEELKTFENLDDVGNYTLTEKMN